MDNRKPNYTLIGLFVIGLSGIGILFIFWLTSFRYHESYNTYVVYLHEEVSGLNINAPVRYNGVKVGHVSSTHLNPNDPQQVILTLKIREGTPITTSTVATLKSEGVTGVDYIGLRALAPHAPLLEAKPGETYPVIPSELSLFLKLSTAVQEVTKTIKDLGNSVNQIFSEPNRRAINNSLQNIDKVTAALGANAKRINAAIKSTATATANLPGISQQLQEILTQINATSANIEALSEELKRNPSILVRGRSPVPPGPGEK